MYNSKNAMYNFMIYVYSVNNIIVIIFQLSEDRELKPSENKFEAAATQPLLNSSPTPPLHSVVHVDDHQVAFSRTESFQGSRRVFQDIDDIKRPLIDHDEDKYKRRPAAELMKRWWK